MARARSTTRASSARARRSTRTCRSTRFGSTEFAEALIDCIVTQDRHRHGPRAGVAQAAEKWGRYEKDTTSGILPLQEWGYPHHYDARTEVEWGYGSLLGERDINEHDFNWLVLLDADASTALFGQEPAVSAEAPVRDHRQEDWRRTTTR